MKINWKNDNYLKHGQITKLESTNSSDLTKEELLVFIQTGRFGRLFYK